MINAIRPQSIVDREVKLFTTLQQSGEHAMEVFTSKLRAMEVDGQPPRQGYPAVGVRECNSRWCVKVG